MAKIQSRDEKIQEQWQKYFKNIEKENDLIRVLLKYYKEEIEDRIKDYYIKNTKTADKNQTNEEYPDIVSIPSKIENISVNELKNLLNKIVNFLSKEVPFSIDNNVDLSQKFKKFYDRWLIFRKLQGKTKNLIPSNSNYLTSLFINNFKGFSDKNKQEDNTIKIKPITLIYGPNSYGKSSIFQTLLLLNQTMKEGKNYKNIALYTGGNDSDMVNLGTFQDFINNHDITKELTIQLTLSYQDERPFSRSNKKHSFILEKKSFCFHFKLEDNVITMPSIDILITEKDFSDFNKPEKCIKETIQITKNNKEDIENIENEIKPGQGKGLEIEKEEEVNELEKIIKNIVYISSYRKAPDRIFIPKQRLQKYVGKNGEYTSEILNNDKSILKKVNEWLEKIVQYTLSTKKKRGTADFVNFDDQIAEVKNINILDLGSGIAQVLPIITQAFKSRNDIILVEEPEIHLHPKAQARIGAMFADAIKEPYNNTFIIETHSENLLLRLERLIKKGKLSKDDVSVIYVHKDKTGSHCIPLEIDDRGHIKDIKKVPDGFFDEGYNELFDINDEE